MIRLPAEGESFGRYRLTRKLGQGGMGVVYAAHDTTLDREVALKLVAPQLASDAEFRARFQREAATLARLNSAHVVHIYDHGEQDGVLYLVTQLIVGGDLQGLIARDGAMPPALAVDVIDQVVLGLVDAHAVGVIHRDIKPANVLIRGRGQGTEAFLCDFGIATAPGTDLSRTGTVAGSLPYMAPERHRGENAGPSGDVYAAGCLLWHALSGSAPYAGTDVEVALGHIQGPIPQLPGKDAFSAAVNGLLQRAMAKEPRKRHPSARALHAELARIAAIAPDSVPLPGATAFRQAIDPGDRRRPRWLPGVLAAAATGAVLLGTLFAAGALDGGSPSTGEAPLIGRSGTPSGSTTGKVVNERPTLVPMGASREAAPWNPAEVAPPDDVPGVEEPRSTTRSSPRQSTRPAPVRTRTVKPAPVTTTATPAPVDHYRCWNGDTVPAYSGCTAPITWTGANHIYPHIPNLTGCHAFSGSSGAMRESWICSYTGGGSSKNWVAIHRWKSVAAAKSYYHDWFRPDARHKTAWIRDGVRYGVAIRGRKGERFRLARIYENEPWTVAVTSPTKAARAAFFDHFTAYRPPSQLRGYKYQ